jgi:hypothetical protein
MTFGQFKTKIEKNLLESYSDHSKFKQTIKEFKQNVLTNKSLSKIYSIYDQLSLPMGIDDTEANEIVFEGINVIRQLLTSIKLPISISENVENKYADIDTLVYFDNVQISERISSKKNIISVLTSPKNNVQESIKIPVSSMIKIANQKLSSYVDTLSEEDKRQFLMIVTEDISVLEEKFETLKNSTVSKLKLISENEENIEVKDKINETIHKIENEKFSQINFIKIKNLEESV